MTELNGCPADDKLDLSVHEIADAIGCHVVRSLFDEADLAEGRERNAALIALARRPRVPLKKPPSPASRLRAALKEMSSAGIAVHRVEIDAAGTVVVAIGKPLREESELFDLWKVRRAR